jgi:hypothetical protein
MNVSNGFWSGMPRHMKLRFFLWLAFYIFGFLVLGQAPILGIILLVLPVLWTVVVLWITGAAGRAFGPFRRREDTVLGYLARYVWSASTFARVAISTIGLIFVLAGLAWISTENMRAEAARPSLTDRATSMAQTASESTQKTAAGWYKLVESWFGWAGDPE